MQLCHLNEAGGMSREEGGLVRKRLLQPGGESDMMGEAKCSSATFWEGAQEQEGGQVTCYDLAA